MSERKPTQAEIFEEMMHDLAELAVHDLAKLAELTELAKLDATLARVDAALNEENNDA